MSQPEQPCGLRSMRQSGACPALDGGWHISHIRLGHCQLDDGLPRMKTSSSPPYVLEGEDMFRSSICLTAECWNIRTCDWLSLRVRDRSTFCGTHHFSMSWLKENEYLVKPGPRETLGKPRSFLLLSLSGSGQSSCLTCPG